MTLNGVMALIMVALWNRADHYIFILWFLSIYLFLFSFLAWSQRPHIGCLPYFHTWCGLSANVECRSEMCCKRLAENTGRKKVAKKSPSGHHRTNLSESSQLRHISTIGKRTYFVKQQYVLQMSSQYGELRPTSGWDQSGSLGHPSYNFNSFHVWAALLHGSPVVGVSQTLRRWTEGTTYARQGDHHVGHWPTF